MCHKNPETKASAFDIDDNFKDYDQPPPPPPPTYILIGVTVT